MLPYISKKDLFIAYNVLFDSGKEGPVDFLRNLQPSLLKAAYRKRALQTHPDRSRILGESKAEMNERFIEISLAYGKLSPSIYKFGHELIYSGLSAE